MFERTITIGGLSKTYAMTGWRLGWAVAPDPIFKELNKLQTQSITCVTSFVQQAGRGGAERTAGLGRRDGSGVQGPQGPDLST